MANIKVSELPAASAASTSQEFEVNDSGTSKKVTGSQIKSFVKDGLVLTDITDVTASVTELNFVDGVTSAIQTQLNTKAPTANPSFTGNVGIGTTTAGSKLELAEASGAVALRLSVGNTLLTNFYASASDTTLMSTTAAPLVFGTNNVNRMIIGAGGGVSGSVIATQDEAEAGTVTTKLMTPQRVAQAIDAQAGSMTLLGTLTTTSGTTQTLSGLDLTSYKIIRVKLEGVSRGGTTSTFNLTMGGLVIASNFGASELLRGTYEYWLNDGAEVEAVEGPSISSFRNSSTSVSLTLTANSFDAGSVSVYGVK